MAKEIIKVGDTANDKKGDSLRAAFQKVNANFTELYAALGIDSDAIPNIGAFEFNGSTMTTTDSTPIVIDQSVTVGSNLTVGGDILPQTANGGDLGSSAKPWKSLYVSSSTIYLGEAALGFNQSGELTVNGSSVAESATPAWNNITDKPTIPDLGNVSESIVPDTDVAYDLGSATNRFRTLYLSGNTIDLGGSLISAASDGTVALPGLSVLYYVPDSIEDYGFLNQVTFSEVPVIIDHFTYLLAFNGSRAGPNQASALAARAGYVPTVYTPILSNGTSGVCTEIVITTPGSYDPSNPETVFIEGVNGDNMVALPQGTDINDWDSLVAAINGEAYPEGYGPIDAGVNMVASTSRGIDPFDQDVNTTDSPNFVNIGLAGIDPPGEDPGYATIGIAENKDLYISLSATATGSKVFEFGSDGKLTAPGEVYGKFFSLRGGNESGTIGNLGYGGDVVVLGGYQGVQIESGAIEGSPAWTFGTGGVLELGADVGAIHANQTTGVITIGDALGSDGSPLAPSTILQVGGADFVAKIAGYALSNPPVWTFGRDRNLTIPGDIKSNGNINIDINLADSTLRRWQFGEDGELTFPDGTNQQTAYPGIVSTHSGQNRIEVGGTVATMDNLSVRLVSSAPGANEVEINYDPDIVAAISINRYGTNVLNGTELLSNGNTDWWSVDNFDTGGDGTEFTVTDYEGKIYRVTVIMANITAGAPSPVAGDAYCVIERLK